MKRVCGLLVGVVVVALAGCSSPSAPASSNTPDPAVMAAVSKQLAADEASAAAAYVPPAPSGHTVRYEISGSARSVSSISFATAGFGISQEANVTLPWQRTIEFPDGYVIATINAQNAGESGSVSCAVWIDGVRVSSNSSNGAFVIAQCSGSTH